MVKPDSWITRMSLEKGMIEPFAEAQVRKGRISFGVSAYGYDMRLSNEFRIMKKAPLGGCIDPKNFDDSLFDNFTGDVCEMPPNSFMLARSMEYFRIPRDILTISFGKSTYARCGVLVNVTPFEPEWEGYVTLGISNTAGVPVKVYAGEGIAQVVFLEASEICEVSYRDKKGKYQAQKKITTAKVTV